MVHYIAVFTSITATLDTVVNLPNGETTLVTHIGTVRLLENLVLSNILYVPSFNFNLISISPLAKSILLSHIFWQSMLYPGPNSLEHDWSI